ncbi:MAG: hypothetical protein RBR49_00770 [Desulfovibrio desulfuricans]|nr:hypothetical protein [Desulfovibrio desulfuricans]
MTFVNDRATGTSSAVMGSGTTSVKNMIAAITRMPRVMYAFVGSSGSFIPSWFAANTSWAAIIASIATTIARKKDRFIRQPPSKIELMVSLSCHKDKL